VIELLKLQCVPPVLNRFKLSHFQNTVVMMLPLNSNLVEKFIRQTEGGLAAKLNG
jgi:hypothetical protein